jgi:diguanylate cyclase (GGDEF)-like protein
MNIHTLHIQHVMLLAIFTLVTVINSFLFKGTKGLHWFSLYNFCALLGAIAIVFRNSIPDFLSIVLGNLCVMGAYASLFLSLCLLFGYTRRELQIHAALVLAGIVTMLLYGWIIPNRLIALSLVLGFQQLQITLQILRKEDGSLRHIGSPLALMVGTLAIVNFVRFFGVIHIGAPVDYLQSGPFLAWIVPINACLQAGTVVAYVWMTSSLLQRELQIQASTDPLTGLLNRRAIEVGAEREIHRCRQQHLHISAVVFDLDGFKHINDSLGHRFGDLALIAVANCLADFVRPSDLAARIGGDEFAILLPRTSLAAAKEMVEDLRDCIAALNIADEGATATVTASFGIAQADNAISWDDLLVRCDKNLYAAKHAGGNTVAATNTRHTLVSL